MSFPKGLRMANCVLSLEEIVSFDGPVTHILDSAEIIP